MLFFCTDIAQTAKWRRTSSAVLYTTENTPATPSQIRVLLPRTLEWTYRQPKSGLSTPPRWSSDRSNYGLIGKTCKNYVQDNRWHPLTTTISFGPKLRYEFSFLYQQRPLKSESTHRNPGIKTAELFQFLQLLIQQRNRRKHFAQSSKSPWQ